MMNGFELSIDNINYKCSGNQSTRDAQNWQITAKVDDFKINIGIPIEKELSRAKAMLFVEQFHCALMQAKKDQKL